MCNLYSITTNQAAIIALFRVVNQLCRQPRADVLNSRYCLKRLCMPIRAAGRCSGLSTSRREFDPANLSVPPNYFATSGLASFSEG
jgi:hypothetical protein